MRPTVLLPPPMPSTDHVAAPPPGTVAVNCCVRDSVIAATVGDTLIVILDRVTEALATELVPPAPAQLRENEVFAVSALVLRLPLVGNAPLQPPVAAHEVAFVELHVSVETPPEATTVGFAVKLAVGTALTVTAAVPAGLVPPGPVQVRE
jgi:hypothetical protein